jgi:hypothetical protein
MGSRRVRRVLRWIAAAWCAAAAAGCGQNGASQLPASDAAALRGVVSPSMPGAISSTAAIWVHPLPEVSPGDGSVDFLSLFKADAPWPNAMQHTAVMGLYAGWIADAPQADVETVVRFLKTHAMTIEIEAPSLQATATCGNNVEGFVPYGQSLRKFTIAYMQRLKALDAPVGSIKVDEPYFFGSVSTEPNACNLPMTTVAQSVAQYAKLVHSINPSVEIGDVEPVIEGPYKPDVVTALGRWHDAYRRANGAPFPFYVSDNDFSNPDWPKLAKELEVQTKSRGMKSGIIYIGNPTDTSDAQWSAEVVARFREYQGANGGKPDFVLFQSWVPYPHHCLPETTATTFTGTVETYVRAAREGPAVRRL